MPLEGGRIFLSGGYDAGSLMLQLKKEGGKITRPEALSPGRRRCSAPPSTRPFYFDGHLFGVRPNGEFVCLDLTGKIVWTSGAANKFGLGPFLMADGCSSS